jgi:flagellar protein FlaG
MDVKLTNLPAATVEYVNNNMTGTGATLDTTAGSAGDVQPAKPQEAARSDTQKATSSNAADAKKDLTREETDLLTKTLNQFMDEMNANLQFVVHDKTHRLMVQVVDPETNKVLKEFPPHELLDTIAAISDYVGALLDKKA